MGHKSKSGLDLLGEQGGDGADRTLQRGRPDPPSAVQGSRGQWGKAWEGFPRVRSRNRLIGPDTLTRKYQFCKGWGEMQIAHCFGGPLTQFISRRS